MDQTRRDCHRRRLQPGNVGDVDYAVAAQQAGFITPVPGGVGSTTIAVLLQQTVAAAEKD
ncbi:bifunctional protein FolD [Mycolicibacterium canariasense]|uniref:Bifunctional protein FolD n=1 Tax=Mycolicibacterium canariasense TaxID=228230 RepID=A0A100W909_MYCCR|nr:bifunctional protein FolD [Mycolicibacterium canariasense]